MKRGILKRGGRGVGGVAKQTHRLPPAPPPSDPSSDHEPVRRGVSVGYFNSQPPVHTQETKLKLLAKLFARMRNKDSHTAPRPPSVMLNKCTKNTKSIAQSTCAANKRQIGLLTCMHCNKMCNCLLL